MGFKGFNDTTTGDRRQAWRRVRVWLRLGHCIAVDECVVAWSLGVLVSWLSCQTHQTRQTDGPTEISTHVAYIIRLT
jgi:hypothetical protein